MRGAMRINKIFVLLCFGAVSFGATVLAQSLTNKPLFEAESIKVVANEKFPEDLECEIFAGPKGSPFFRMEGKQSQVKTASIESSGAGPTVSLVQKGKQTNSYTLYLFSEDAEGKVFGLFDLNCDGTWDVKRTPTRTEKNFILFQGQWLAVDSINGLDSEIPTAEKAGKRYMFQGVWKLLN